MTSEEAQFKQMLAAAGYNLTSARLTVFRLLNRSEPMAIRDIVATAKGSIDRVSVYRNLALFESTGIAHRVYIGWKHKWELSDAFTSHHHHLSCLGCGKVIDIQDETHITNFIQQIAQQATFKPVKHHFEIEGYCADCQAQAANR